MKPGQLTWPQRGALWLRLAIRLVLSLAAVLLVSFFGRPLLTLFAPFVCALIAAALLNPLVKWFQRKLGWSRSCLLYTSVPPPRQSPGPKGDSRADW